MRLFGLLAALAMRRSGTDGTALGAIRDRMTARRAGSDNGISGERSQRTVDLTPGVIAERNVAYGSEPAQRLDVYRQAGATRATVILFVHGGGWRRGDKAMPQMIRNKMPHWVAKGFVFLSINYRMLPDANPLQQADDVSRALAFAQNNAGSWGGDAARVVLVGHSAGAHLVSLITADADLFIDHGVQPWLATIGLDSAALDMEAVMNRPHYPFYDPVFGSDAHFWREASPIHRLNGKPAAPMLLVCSSARDDSCMSARDFAAKAMAFGGSVTVQPVDLNHLQINDQLGLPSAYTEAVDGFLRRVGA
jgi:arylformamidase